MKKKTNKLFLYRLSMLFTRQSAAPRPVPFPQSRLGLFTLGGTLYGLIEILWRGNTHWSMLLTGGCCLTLLDRLDRRHAGEWLFVRCIRGSALITGVELLVGVIVNRLLGLAVWDYSGQWGNLLGQVCPLYSLLWYFLCYPAFGLLKKLRGEGQKKV